MSYVECDRCGVSAYSFQIRSLKSIFQTKTIKSLCEDCGKKADSFVDNYGVKTDKQITSLMRFLNNGKKSNYEDNKLFTSLNNAGYY